MTVDVLQLIVVLIVKAVAVAVAVGGVVHRSGRRDGLLSWQVRRLMLLIVLLETMESMLMLGVVRMRRYVYLRSAARVARHSRMQALIAVDVLKLLFRLLLLLLMLLL